MHVLICNMMFELVCGLLSPEGSSSQFTEDQTSCGPGSRVPRQELCCKLRFCDPEYSGRDAHGKLILNAVLT